MTKSLSKAIFYIKYFAEKHGEVIERKATLDDECFEVKHKHKKFGYPYFKYVDVGQLNSEIKNGKPQYSHASKSWEINQTRTIS